MEFSVIIAAYNRCNSLRRLLASIAENFDEREADYEVIVANNARNPKMAQEIAALTEEFRRAHGNRFRHIEEPLPGKCRAQNQAIRLARGEVIAFFDDDVVVTPNWLPAAGRHFRETSDQAMQGPVLIPPEWQDNETFLRTHHKFKTINFARYSRKLKHLKTLTGANMAVRREVFSRIGFFNEDLGPGRSGISEDVEFAARLVRSGGFIGYEPDAAVYHEVDWDRLTEEFFRARHRQQGASRYLYKHPSLSSITGNLVRAVAAYGWYSLRGVVRKKYRAKGRIFHYGAMLERAVKGPKAGARG